MSPYNSHQVSEEDLSRLSALTQAIAEIEQNIRNKNLDWPEDRGFQEAGRLLGLAARLYTAAAEAQSDKEEPLPDLGITSTDAVVCSAALLKDQNITLFEMSGWYTRIVSRASQSNSWRANIHDAPEGVSGASS